MSSYATAQLAQVLDRACASESSSNIRIDVCANLSIDLSPAWVLRKLLTIIAFLVSINLIILALDFNFGHARLLGLADKFNLNREANVPSWYSASSILLAAALLWLVARFHQRHNLGFVRHWNALAAVFVLLSLDEAASFHEMMLLDIKGPRFFYFAWLMVGLPMLALLAIAYFRFLFALPLRTRNLFLGAAALYIAGAAGMEMIDGWWASLHGSRNLTYGLLTTLEESLEMLGIAFFIYAILDYLRTLQHPTLVPPLGTPGEA